MDPRARTSMARPSHTISQSSSSTIAAVHPVRRRRGVRRGREENAAVAVEIEELDSEVMRQNSYNYFQQHGSRFESNNTPDSGAAIQLDVDGTAHVSSRKRQRTLAEQLEDLCLQSSDGDKTASANVKKSSGAAAAAACRQAWNRVFAAQMVAQQQRAAAAKAKAAALAQPRAPSPPVCAVSATADVEMESSAAAASPSGGEDADLEDADDADENVARDAQGLKVFGAVPDVKGMFFNGTGARQRPMERMFRHYVTMAAERSSRTDGAASASPRGDELVLFQPGPTSLEFPYSLFTPEQIEDLRARHNRKKKRQGAADRSNGRSILGVGNNGVASNGGNFDNTWRFQEIDSSDEADVSSSAEDSDMDMSGDGEAAAPQLAGALSHGEWFVEDDDEDNDADGIDDDL